MNAFHLLDDSQGTAGDGELDWNELSLLIAHDAEDTGYRKAVPFSDFWYSVLEVGKRRNTRNCDVTRG